MQSKNGKQDIGAMLLVVVDDDEAMREATTSLLKSVGFCVEAFASAEEFLNEVENKMPDCLILDVRMPGMGGLELQKILNKKKVRIPIVFISAHSEENAQEKAFAAGAVGFIPKPFDEDSLLDVVGLAIGSRNEMPEMKPNDETERGILMTETNAPVKSEEQVRKPLLETLVTYGYLLPTDL